MRQAAAPSEPRDWGGLPRRWSIPAPPDEIRRRDELQRGHPASPRLHAPPPRRSSAVAGGPRHRGGSTPSRLPQLLSAVASRPVETGLVRVFRGGATPIVPIHAFLERIHLLERGGPPLRHRRAGIEKAAPAAHSLLFFSARVDQGGTDKGWGGAPLGVPRECIHGSFAAADFLFFSNLRSVCVTLPFVAVHH